MGSTGRRHRRRRRNRMATFMAMLLGVIVVAALASLLFVSRTVKSSVTVEAGVPTVAAVDFLNDEGDAAFFVSDVSAISLTKPGEYPVSIGVGGRQYESRLIVRDTIAPTGTATDQKTAQGRALKAEEFVRDVADATTVTVTYKKEPDFKKAGEQTVELLLTDAAGNETRLTARLTVTEDTVAPELFGVANLSVYAGSTVSYKQGVYVKDDKDPNPKLTVNSASVDLTREGVYEVIYTAADASGNETSKTVQVTVLPPVSGTTVVEESRITALADETLAKIVSSGMTKKQQVTAIYNWARTSFGYSGHSDKTDWMQGAYQMLTKRAGDCFSYFAVCKLMFERLGIDNMDVRKVKNYDGDSDHFWSLVSVDGGATWYHFDATPRVGAGDDFCLVTDAFLDAYSAAHKNCHNRDKSLYPATPEA